MEDITDQLIKDFLAKGGQIEKLDPVIHETSYVVRSTMTKVPELKTLAEAEELYGEKRVVKRNPARIHKQLEKIDKEALGEYADELADIFEKYKNIAEETEEKGGVQVETNKNKGSTGSSKNS